MPIEQVIGNRNESLVPLGIAGLIPANQQQSRAPGIERKQNSKLPRANFPTQFFHVRMAGTCNHISVRASESGPALLEKFNHGIDLVLLLFQ